MTERLRRTRGFLVDDTSGGRVESETFTCNHCNHLVEIPHKAPPDEAGGICYQCYALICPACARKRECTPFMKKLEEYERRSRFRRELGL